MKKIFTLITLGLVTTILAGCPSKKSGSNTPYVGPYPGQGCSNCGFQQATFSQSVTSALPQGTLTLSLVGDANQMNLWAHQAQNPLFAYQGQIAVNGQLNLTSEIYLGQCRLPMGAYTLSTLQSGIYNMGVFQIPAVQLVGPVTAVVSLAEGVILTDGNGYITSFGAVMYGQAGVSVWSSSMPMLSQYPNGYYPNAINPQFQPMNNRVSCGDMIGVRF